MIWVVRFNLLYIFDHNCNLISQTHLNLFFKYRDNTVIMFNENKWFVLGYPILSDGNFLCVYTINENHEINGRIFFDLENASFSWNGIYTGFDSTIQFGLFSAFLIVMNY